MLKQILLSLAIIVDLSVTGFASLGGHAANAISSGAAIVTTAGVTTVTGPSSTFVIWCADTTNTFNAASDNKGNTYTQTGTTVQDAGTGIWVSRWRKVNGAGGSGHTFSCNSTQSTNPMSVWGLEITNADTTNSLDITTTPTVDSSSAYQSLTTGTLGQANEFIVSFASDNSTGVGDNFTASGGTPGFTLIDSVTDGSTLITGATSYEIVSSTTAQQATWSSSQGTAFIIGIDTFKVASSGGTPTNKLLLQQTTP